MSTDALEVKKLPRFRVMDHKLVQRNLNPRLPKFSVLKTHEIPPAESKRKHTVSSEHQYFMSHHCLFLQQRWSEILVCAAGDS